MNKYGSIVRRHRARGIFSGPLNPPANFQFATHVSGSGLLDVDINTVNPGTNIRLLSMGLYSNFADGLVAIQPLVPNLRAGVFFANSALPPTPLTGTINVLAGQYQVTGVGTLFLTEVAFDDIIFYKLPSGSFSGLAMSVLQVVDDVTLIMRELPSENVLGADAKVLTGVTFTDTDLPMTGAEMNFNEMYPCDLFMHTAVFGPVSQTNVIGVTLTQPGEYLTKAIDPSFATDIAYLDVVAELEYMR